MPLYSATITPSPANTTQNIITPTDDAVSPLRLRRHSATQTAPMQTWEKVDGTVLSSMTANGGTLNLGNGVDVSTPMVTFNGSFQNQIRFNVASTFLWSILTDGSAFRIQDQVSGGGRILQSITPGTQGLANTTFLDQVRVQAGAGQSAGQLVFYASDGTTIQASLIGDAANTLALRNGVNAQALRIYNTFTDASNFELGSLGWISGEFVIQPARAGTGASRALVLQTNTGGGGDNSLYLGTAAIKRWLLGGSTGHFLANSNNTYDIGDLAASYRPRTGYFGTSVVSPLLTLGTTVNLLEDAANTLALRNGANAQEMRIYHSYTDASNNYGHFLKQSSGDFSIQYFENGSGVGNSSRIIISSKLGTVIATGGNTRLTISSTGAYTFDASDGGIRINNQTNAAAAQAGTLLNSPVAGNPNFWLPVSIAGVTRYIPCF